MDDTTYQAEYEIEQSHWWFAGRRNLFGRMISTLKLSSDAFIVDVGTSTGTNLRLLAEQGFNNVTGLDPSSVAQEFCRKKGFSEVILGDVRALPFEDGSVDLVLATDILEHVDEEEIALSEIFRTLTPGGAVLMTVPAFESLWGIQDEVSQHYRRYRMAGFRKLLETTGFRVSKAFYFNYILFLPIWITRRLLMVFRPSIRAETDINSPLINKLLYWVFSLDIRSAEFLRPPFGVSILVLARKLL